MQIAERIIIALMLFKPEIFKVTWKFADANCPLFTKKSFSISLFHIFGNFLQS